MMIWERSEGAFFAFIDDAHDRPLFCLVVEEAPGDGWDWVVWSAMGPALIVGEGVAKTAQHAMRAAEEAV